MKIPIVYKAYSLQAFRLHTCGRSHLQVSNAPLVWDMLADHRNITLEVIMEELLIDIGFTISDGTVCNATFSNFG